ncbi:MAG: serine protease SohB, partial [Francisellaceae bacterium]
MWLNNLADYGLFLIEAITVVAAILFVVSGIVAIGAKNKKSKGKLSIIHLHDKYKDVKSQLEQEVYDNKYLKKELKVKKKLAKGKRKKDDKEQIKPKPKRI